MTDRRLELMPLAQVRGAPRNPKEHDEGAIGAIGASVGRFGYVEPAVIDERTGRLVAGHGRIKTLRGMKADGQSPPDGVKVENGDWLIPVLRGVEFESDEDAEGYLLASNRTTELGGWDDADLTEMLGDLAAADALEGVGWDAEDVDRMLIALVEDAKDSVPDTSGAEALRERWGVEPGQVWSIGRHRLMCGDNGRPEDIDKLMDGKKANAVVTDPPFELSGSAVLAACGNFSDVAVVLTGSRQAFGLCRDGWEYHHDFIWRRRRPRSFPTDNQPVFYHNTILVLTRNGKKNGWKRPRPDFGSVIELANSEFVDTEMGHGKSAELFVEMLSGFRHKIWADPYAGTGASLLGCEALGKTAYCMEISPTTTAVALQRFQDSGLVSEPLT